MSRSPSLTVPPLPRCQRGVLWLHDGDCRCQRGLLAAPEGPTLPETEADARWAELDPVATWQSRTGHATSTLVNKDLWRRIYSATGVQVGGVPRGRVGRYPLGSQRRAAEGQVKESLRP